MVLLAVCDRELIQSCLAEAGVCPRCCLRFTGERYSKFYRDLGEAENQTETEQTKKARPNCCVACLGTLQDHLMVPLLDQVADSINTCGYDAETFSLTMSLPLCIAIRQHALLVYLRHGWIFLELLSGRGIFHKTDCTNFPEKFFIMALIFGV